MIVIAAGTYTPSEQLDASDPDSDDPRTATFEITGDQDGLKIYGGWAGTESAFTTPTEVENALGGRDLPSNETILSGDIGIEGNASDNAYHVLVFNGGNGIGPDVAANITGDTMIGGVTVSGGNANNGGFPDNAGGGLFCDGEGSSNGSSNACSLQIRGSIFTDNSADFGGAILSDGSEGGESSPQIIDAIFSGNSAGDDGGAVYNYGYNGVSSPKIINVTFSGNSASTDGGAIYNYGDTGVSSPQITNATLTGNSAGDDGGAIYNNGYNGASSPEIIGTTFTGNAATDGGAIYNDGGDGGVSSPQITNSILWGNSAGTDGNEIFNFGASPTLSHTLVEGLNPSGTGNLDGTDPANAPRFVDADGPDGAFGTLDDDVRLALGSPAIGAGDDTALPADVADLDGDGNTSETIPFDLAGNARIQDGTVDLGAYEGGVDLALTLFVDADAMGAGDGTSWTDAYTDLQDALSAATGNDQIWIAAGTYTPRAPLDASDARTATFAVTGDQDGLEIYGGFARHRNRS